MTGGARVLLCTRPVAAATRRFAGYLVLCVAAICEPTEWNDRRVAAAQPSSALVGVEFDHAVSRNETWQSIGSRFGIEPRTLAALNSSSVKSPLRAGRVVRVDGRHLVPDAVASGLVINVPQRMLFLKRDGHVVTAYPVALGRPTWPTFIGQFTVVALERDPVWDVPPSIQEELRRAGKPVPTRVPPGPTNPLGKYWLGLSEPNFGIHGTIAPRSIFRFETHGCIRLHPDDVADLWPRVVVGMPGEVIYEPILVRVVGERLLLEAHADVYRRVPDLEGLLHGSMAAAGISNGVDWVLARRVIAEHDGRPHDVGSAAALP